MIGDKCVAEVGKSGRTGEGRIDVQGEKERVRLYRKYVYETGAILSGDKQYVKTIDEKVVAKERKGDFEITRTDRFLYRTRYFTDSGTIGSQEFVFVTYQKVQTSVSVQA
jgi:putative transposase